MGKLHGQRAGHQAALSETDLVDLAVAQIFPQAQQPFFMFLQAADSHRLNTCLVRQDLILWEVSAFVCLYRRGWGGSSPFQLKGHLSSRHQTSYCALSAA